MKYSIFKKSNWMAWLAAGILFLLLAACPVFAEYSGHVASFKSEENAAKFVDSLKAKGLAAYYQKENVPGKGEFYRSYIGEYKTLPLAQKALTKLKKTGEIEFFTIQKTTVIKKAAITKQAEVTAQKNEPAQKPESKTETVVKKNEPAQKSENKTEAAAQDNEQAQKPESKVEAVAQSNEPAQKPEKKIDSPIDTRNYYSGIKGIILKNGKIVRGKILSIDDNDVLKIRTKRGKILSYSFTRDVREYITEYEP